MKFSWNKNYRLIYVNNRYDGHFEQYVVEINVNVVEIGCNGVIVHGFSVYV